MNLTLQVLSDGCTVSLNGVERTAAGDREFLTAFPADDDHDKFTAGNACTLFAVNLSTA